MKRLRSKMTTEELADSLGVARQTVNRWIRQKGWKTEGINGVKGGRARLIHIDARVREHIMSLRPSVTVRLSINWQKRPLYGMPNLWRTSSNHRLSGKHDPD
jgi:excisionase family DNA binding protein